MSPQNQFDRVLAAPEPLLALAPMQDITDLAFWRLMTRYGGADVYYTEYFRVHAHSRPEKWILDSILHNPTHRPVVAQLIGNDIPALVRTAKELQQYPIAAVDFNLGCPAPVVYKKCAGGGLLRDLDRVEGILARLREAVGIRFTVKTRIGFDSPHGFEELLGVFARHALDLVVVHGRSVAQMYQLPVRYDLIALAARTLTCPVVANGNVHSAAQALEVLAATGAHGLMIGRGAIRNPWLFAQIRQQRRGEPVRLPTGREVLDYLRALYEAESTPGVRERLQVERLKKFMNFLGDGVESTGQFLHRIRRVQTRTEFFRTCADYLDHDRPMPLEPLESRPARVGIPLETNPQSP